MFNLFKKSESEPKYCVDCLYCELAMLKREDAAIDFAKCIHPKITKIDLVSGKKTSPCFCSTERGVFGKCGTKGKYFELKQV